MSERAGKRTGAPQTRGGGRLFNILLYVLLAAMGVELVLLVMQNRELKATVGELRQQLLSAQSVAPAIFEGQVLGPLELAGIDGEVALLEYEETDQDTILMVFSPTCPACNENMPNWKAIEERYAAGGIKRLVYVSTAGEDETREYVDAYALEAPVLVSEDMALAAYNVTHTPTTLVVGPGGVVKRVWVGVLPETVLESL